MSDPLAARKGALTLLSRVLDEGEMIDEGALPADLPGPDRARAMTLTRETLRRLGALDAVLAAFVKRPPSGAGRAILRLGAAELLIFNEAAHGAVDAAVRLAKATKGADKIAGFANAVLRRVAAEGPAIWDGLDHARLSTPEWLWRALRSDWGKAGVRTLAEAHLRGAPFDLTPKDGDAAIWAERLGGVVTPTGSVRLTKPGKLTELAGYADGAWWAQDAAAAAPARLAGPGEGRRALDLCAAPGGKAMQLAAAGWSVTAVDASASRMDRVAENLARTGLTATLEVADAMAASDEAPFDLVLLDAPCTATGTIRRHPELPHIRDGAGVHAAAAAQTRMLDAAWARTAPGGVLIFCTCSLHQAEGEARANAFLKANDDAARAPIAPEEIGDPDLLTSAGDFRARPDHWPEIGGLDGFFASRLTKRR